MRLNSWGLSFFFGILIASITTAFLGLLPDVSVTVLIVAFTLSFSTSYILMRILAELLFFREVNNIYDVLEKFQDNDLSFLRKNKSKSIFNPLRKINLEIHDYARLKQREIEDLKKMETFRREFIADVSHELKTPIFSAQGFVHTLLDGAVEDKKVRGKFLKKAARSLDGLDILVQDLLTISQMEIGEIKMHFEDFDIVNLCEEVIDQLEGKVEKKDHAIELNHGDSPTIFVKADYQRIYQVMINLVSNAIKYTKKKGNIYIRIEPLEETEKVQVTVQDTGRGIPKEDISRIFERFYRVEKSRSKERGGTGLGLSIVKHIMEGHQSRIQVESEVAVGSTFRFVLDKGQPAPKIVWEEEDDQES